MRFDMSVWQGRIDAEEGPLAVRWHQRVRPWDESLPPGVVLIGFACDEGVDRNQGRVGAAAGPSAIRRALANFAWHQPEQVYDAGDIDVSDERLESGQDDLADYVSSVIDAGHRPIVVGGGHETAWGTFLALTMSRPTSVIGIINVDAHFDLRTTSQASSGTPFAQMAQWCGENKRPFRYLCLGVAEAANSMAAFEQAAKHGVQWRPDSDLAPWNLKPILAALDAFAQSVDVLYLSIDLDVLPASTMPAVSAPAALGVPLESVEAIIAAVLETRKVAAVDVVEFNPSLDTNGCAARVAARVVWQVARNWVRNA